MKLNGKAALITGAAGGLGEGIARRFAAEGARVVIADTNDEAGSAVADSIGSAADFVHLDVTDEGQWEAAIAKCGQLDVLINNAGVTKVQDIETVTASDFNLIMNVDVLGVLLGCKMGVRAMQSDGGSIINIASALAKKAEPATVIYAAAKAAACSVTKTVALHCAQKGYPIRCNAILPGIFKTPMLEQAIMSMPDPQAALAEWSAKQPSGRLGEVHELAELATYLASDGSAFMTGAELAIDGGNLLK